MVPGGLDDSTQTKWTRLTTWKEVTYNIDSTMGLVYTYTLVAVLVRLLPLCYGTTYRWPHRTTVPVLKSTEKSSNQSESTDNVAMVEWYYLIIVGVAGFAAGAVIFSGITACCAKSLQRPEKGEEQYTYIDPPEPSSGETRLPHYK